MIIVFGLINSSKGRSALDCRLFDLHGRGQSRLVERVHLLEGATVLPLVRTHELSLVSEAYCLVWNDHQGGIASSRIPLLGWKYAQFVYFFIKKLFLLIRLLI